MASNRQQWISWIGIVSLGAGLVAIARVDLKASPRQPSNDNKSSISTPAALANLGYRFDGAPSCASEKCHGGEKSQDRPDYWGNEYTLWHGLKDPHHTAYRTLLNAQSKEITAKLNIPHANSSKRCTNCHSTDATGPGGEDLQGKEYSAAEGVSCDSCHGPSQKWLEPHAQLGWIRQQRAAMSHADLLKRWGLYDTQPILWRAQRCVGCHLSTEGDIVSAGHPQPVFEMNHFSTIYPERHWIDVGASTAAELWASGQAAELRQNLLCLARDAQARPPAGVDALKGGYERVMGHYVVFSPLLATLATPQVGALKQEMSNLSAAMSKPDAPSVAGLASAAAGELDRLAPLVAALKLDPAASARLLSVIVLDDQPAALGPASREQQAYSIEALAKAAGAETVSAAAVPMLPKKPGQPVSAADFAKALQDVRAKLPK